MEEKNYGVFQKGGSIGMHDYFIKTGLTKEEAKEYAKRMRKTLTRGEREYYGMSYVIRIVKER